jgi:hypothetical protein
VVRARSSCSADLGFVGGRRCEVDRSRLVAGDDGGAGAGRKAEGAGEGLADGV